MPVPRTTPRLDIGTVGRFTRLPFAIAVEKRLVWRAQPWDKAPDVPRVLPQQRDRPLRCSHVRPLYSIPTHSWLVHMFARALRHRFGFRWKGPGAAFLGVAPEGSSITRVFWRTSAIVGERGSGQSARVIASSRLAEIEGLGGGREGFAGSCCPLARHDIKHLPSDSVPSHLNLPRSLSTDQPDSGSICLDEIRAGVCHLCMLPAPRPARRSSSRSLPH